MRAGLGAQEVPQGRGREEEGEREPSPVNAIVKKIISPEKILLSAHTCGSERARRLERTLA